MNSIENAWSDLDFYKDNENTKEQQEYYTNTKIKDGYVRWKPSSADRLIKPINLGMKLSLLSQFILKSIKRYETYYTMQEKGEIGYLDVTNVQIHYY